MTQLGEVLADVLEKKGAVAGFDLRETTPRRKSLRVRSKVEVIAKKMDSNHHVFPNSDNLAVF